MKRLGFLNLRGISGQIAALVVASIIAIHLILTATFLIHRPDQPDPSIDRGHALLVASVQLLGVAPAAERPRLFADIARAFPQLDIESLPPGPAVAANEAMARTCAVCGGASAAATGSFHCRRKMISTRSASRCRTAR
jgi:hypothetical protein